MARPSSWIAEMLGREVKLSPRKSPDEIPAARAFWNLEHLNQNLPEMAAVHERVVLRSRQGVDLTAEIYARRGKGRSRRCFICMAEAGFCGAPRTCAR